MKKNKVVFLFVLAVVVLIFAYGAFNHFKSGGKWADKTEKTNISKTGTNKQNQNGALNLPDLFRFHAIFDQSNEQVYSPFDTGFSGMSRFAIRIRELGGSVSINTRPLPDFLPKLKGKNTILILGVAMYRAYQDSAVKAIKEYLHNGGSVFLMIEHDNLLGNAGFQNKLLQEFDIRALPTSAIAQGTTPQARFWPYCESTEFNLQKVQLFLPAPLEIADETFSLLKVSNPGNRKYTTVAVKRTIGRGTVIALGDAEAAWNGFNLVGIDVAENGAFIDQAFSLLAGIQDKTKNKTIPSRPAAICKSDRSKRKILIETGGYSFIPLVPGYSAIVSKFADYGCNIDLGGADTIDYKGYDLVVVMNPLSAEGLSRNILQADKVLVAGDGQSSYLETKEIKNFLEKMSGQQVTEAAYPLNVLLAEEGLKFSSSTLVTEQVLNGYFTHFQVPAELDRTTIDLNRAAVLDVDAASYSILAESGGRSWPSTNITPKQVGRKPVKPFIPPEGTVFDGYPVIAKSEKILAISDITLLNDASMSDDSGKALFSHIIDWLED